MKFKTFDNADYKGITITDRDGDVLEVQQRADGKKGLYISTNYSNGVLLSGAKALKLAWAIIDELNNS